MPIWLGVQGERVGLRIAAELADGWNFNGAADIATFGTKLDTLRRHCDAVGRDIGSIEVSAQQWVKADRIAEARADALALIAAGVQHLVLYMDGREGPGVVDALLSEVLPAIRDATG